MMDFALPLLIGLVILGLLYLRVRRHFGRQKVSFPRLVFRMSLGAVLAVIILLLPAAPVWAKVAGLSLGFALSLVSLSLTRFERVDGTNYFTPNPYIGLAIVSLLVGRIVYRLFRLRERLGDLEPGSFPVDGGFGLVGNPISTVLILAFLSYYAVYYSSVLRRSRSMAAEV